jgi:hypothetical protein
MRTLHSMLQFTSPPTLPRSECMIQCDTKCGYRWANSGHPAATRLVCMSLAAQQALARQLMLLLHAPARRALPLAT